MSSSAKGDHLDGYNYSSVTFVKKKPSISKTANRFCEETINSENVFDNIPILFAKVEDGSSQELSACLPNTEMNTNNVPQSSYIQDWSLMNVRKWVASYDRKQMRTFSLMSVLDSGVVDPNDRRELIRICVAGMVEYNEGNLYPPCSLKTQLAKDIISAFPKLCSSNGGYEHFFDPKHNRGFIEFRLKTLRLKLNPSEKKRTPSSHTRERRRAFRKKPLTVETSEELLDELEFRSKISGLLATTPTQENKMAIFKLTDETRPNRRNQIRSVEQISLNTIFNMYPRFKDFEGELIRREFSALYPNSDSFVDKFTSYYTPRILQYCSSTKPQLLLSIQDIEDNHLKALILLPELLPSPNYTKRKDKKSQEPRSSFRSRLPKLLPNESLLQFVRVPDEFLLHEILHRSSPFLICNTTSKERKGDFYIKVEGHVIRVGSNPIDAFDVLLKLHYCFDVPFASDLVYFYDFITGCILQLNEPTGCCVALNSSLSNIFVSNIEISNVFTFSS